MDDKRLLPPKAIGEIADNENAKLALAKLVASGKQMNFSANEVAYKEFRYSFETSLPIKQVEMLQNKWLEIAVQTYPKFNFYEEDSEIISKLLTQIIARYVVGVQSELNHLKGVYLWGNYRIGKSILMRSFAYFANYLQQVLEEPYPQPPLPQTSQDKFFVECPEEVTKFIEAKLGIIPISLLACRMTFDEIGLEPQKVSYMKNDLEFMGYILNQRNKLYVNTLASKKTPLITNLIGNISPTEFETIYGKRLTLRMLEMCEPLEWVNGNSKTEVR